MLIVGLFVGPALAGEQKRKKQPKTQSTSVAFSKLSGKSEVVAEWQARPFLVAADSTLVAVLRGEVFSSQDGGRTWARRGALAVGGWAARCEAVAVGVVDRTRWRVLARSGQLIETTDAGASWSVSSELKRISGLETGVAVTGRLGGEGVEWAALEVPGGSTTAVLVRDGAEWSVIASLPVRSQALWRDHTGWVLLAGGEVYRAAPDGSHGTKLAGLEGARLNALAFADGQMGWIAASDGLIICTRDGGHTWLARPVAAGVTFEGLSFVDTSTGLAIGARGSTAVVLGTRDGGVTWRQYASGAAPMSLPALSPGGQVWVIDAAGTVFGGSVTGPLSKVGVLPGVESAPDAKPSAHRGKGRKG